MADINMNTHTNEQKTETPDTYKKGMPADFKFMLLSAAHAIHSRMQREAYRESIELAEKTLGITDPLDVRLHAYSAIAKTLADTTLEVLEKEGKLKVICESRTDAVTSLAASPAFILAFTSVIADICKTAGAMRGASDGKSAD